TANDGQEDDAAVFHAEHGRMLLLFPALRTQDADHGDFIAGLKFRTAQAVLPGFERKLSALDHMEAGFGEEAFHVSEGENGVETVELGFVDESVHQYAADAVFAVGFGDGERANLSHGG